MAKPGAMILLTGVVTVYVRLLTVGACAFKLFCTHSFENASASAHTHVHEVLI